jgi:hypothetical protein
VVYFSNARIIEKQGFPRVTGLLLSPNLNSIFYEFMFSVRLLKQQLFSSKSSTNPSRNCCRHTAYDEVQLQIVGEFFGNRFRELSEVAS